jgi:hypothetical protein
MNSLRNSTENFVLACAKDDSTVAVLCRTEGYNLGPAVCSSKKDAVKLKTKLANDERAMINSCALAIIKTLLVYKVTKNHVPVWDGESLWAYLPDDSVKCVESQQLW